MQDLEKGIDLDCFMQIQARSRPTLSALLVRPFIIHITQAQDRGCLLAVRGFPRRYLSLSHSLTLSLLCSCSDPKRQTDV
jgi:hypothetical protein